ncbi:MAG: ferritin-like domain-containing protein [Chitinophagaceae bacterium]
MEKQIKAKKSSSTAKPASAASGTKPAVKNNSSSKSNTVLNQDSSLLEKYVLDSIKDIYWAEKHLLKALPKMNKAATTPQLKQAFTEHLAVTQEHVARLDKVFELLGKKAQAKKCDAMAGLTMEADGIIEETEKGSLTRDVALIMAAQKVEHYEIATYGGLAQITKTMGKNDISEIFAQTLAEEKEADQALTDIAENNINMEAENEGDGEEDDKD